MPFSKNSQTPDDVLAELMQGNERFVRARLTNFQAELASRIAEGVKGQLPKAYILSCIDSRVPVENVFDQHIGDVFVGRVAGNVATADQMGSMEFAGKMAGVKLVMVMGHEACSAVMGACDDLKLGNFTGLLDQIKPAMNAVPGHQHDRSSGNPDFVNEVVRANVHHNLIRLRRESPVISALENEGCLKIVGAYYSLQDGRVTLLD